MKKQHSTLRLKTYHNVYTDKKRVLQIAVMDQYGRIFETFINYQWYEMDESGG